jgi:hypothetical protein
MVVFLKTYIVRSTISSKVPLLFFSNIVVATTTTDIAIDEVIDSNPKNEDNILEAAEEDDDDLDLEDEAIRVEVDFDVAVMSDVVKNNDSFFIILCEKAFYMNLETFTDEWKNKWSSRDMLIRGFYYERVSAYKRGKNMIYGLL